MPPGAVDREFAENFLYIRFPLLCPTPHQKKTENRKHKKAQQQKTENSKQKTKNNKQKQKKKKQKNKKKTEKRKHKQHSLKSSKKDDLDVRNSYGNSVLGRFCGVRETQTSIDLIAPGPKKWHFFVDNAK